MGTGVGGGLLLTGGVLSLVAEKWMKYSTIKPVLENDRVGLSILFNPISSLYFASNFKIKTGVHQ